MGYTVQSLPQKNILSLFQQIVDRLTCLWLEVILYVYTVRSEPYLLDVIFVRFIMIDCKKALERAD